jgi:hypothetical protein
MSRNRLLVPAALVAAALVTVSSVSYAAGARSVTLGQLNKSAAATTLQRTTPGPALGLRTRPTSPPLTVTSKKKVTRLNADLLDGLDAATLSPATRTYVETDPPAEPTGSLTYEVPMRPGSYRVEVTASLVAETEATTIGFCGYYLDGSYLAGQSSPVKSSVGYRGNISVSSVVTTTGATPLSVNCLVEAGTFTLADFTPLTISVTPVRARSTTEIAPAPEPEEQPR